MRYIEPHGHMVSRVTDDYVDMVTAGCQAGPPALYCPDQPVTREQIAAFLTRTFSLLLYGP